MTLGGLAGARKTPTVFLRSNQGCLSGWLLGSNLIVLQGATSGENDFGEQRFGLQKMHEHTMNMNHCDILSRKLMQHG